MKLVDGKIVVYGLGRRGIIRAFYDSFRSRANKKVVVRINDLVVAKTIEARNKTLYEIAYKEECEARTQRAVAEFSMYLTMAARDLSLALSEDASKVSRGEVSPNSVIVKYGRPLATLVTLVEETLGTEVDNLNKERDAA